ncbi:argininosuccinate synthase [candidate division NPL-UPA2 bacterium]|nr:argininosuccinate synthase [candidate division NPL-UPA2 bacterium]
MATPKVVLAYSGGLDTSVCLKWLQEERKLQVVTFSAEIGQGLNFEELRSKALSSGASKVYIEDLREKFLSDYIFPALRAGAHYEDEYLLGTALGRPLIVRGLVEVAEMEGAQTVAHGCTGKGNDQIRFEVGVSSLNPNLKLIAPLREWSLGSREEEMDYARRYNIPVSASKESPYSIDKNLWGVSIECGVLEDPWEEPLREIYQLTVDPAKAAAAPTYLEIYFEEGIPTKLDGKDLSPIELVTRLNEIGGKNGVGRVDMVENRRLGIKSREIYECPAGTILHSAHQALEALTLDREILHFKKAVSQRYGELVYDGLWFSPLREALDAFVRESQKNVTGTVRVKLLRGKCEVVGRKSDYSLYDKSLATYGKEDAFDHQAAKGFIDLWGLPYRVKAMRRGGGK